MAAAGNDAINNDTSAPSGYPEVITVGHPVRYRRQAGGPRPAVRRQRRRRLTQFSDYGRNITVAAVATCITTDYNDGTLIYWDGNKLRRSGSDRSRSAHAGIRTSLGTRDQIKAALKLTAEYDGSLAGDPIKPAEGVLNVAWLWRLLEVAESKH